MEQHAILLLLRSGRLEEMAIKAGSRSAPRESPRDRRRSEDFEENTEEETIRRKKTATKRKSTDEGEPSRTLKESKASSDLVSRLALLKPPSQVEDDPIQFDRDISG